MPATAAKKTEAKKLPVVPESKLKFSKKVISKRAQETKRKLKRAAVIAQRKRENLVRAEKYQNEYIKADRREIKLRRLAKQRGQYYVPGEAKLAFVIRIRGWVGIMAIGKERFWLCLMNAMEFVYKHNLSFLAININFVYLFLK